MPARLSNGQRTAISPEAKLSQGISVNTDLCKTGNGLSRGPKTNGSNANAPWSNTWPAAGASLDIDFANDRSFIKGLGQGNSMQGITFTRASNATYVGSDGLLKGSGSDKGPLGLNLLYFPQDFQNWDKAIVSITPNTIIAPDGTLTGDMLTTSEPLHALYQYIPVIPSTTYTFSWYAKLSTLTPKYSVFNATSLVNIISPTLYSTGTSVGNGWFRYSATFTTPVGCVGIYVYPVRDSGTTGDIFIWGAQLELGSIATTYYPTNINTPRFDWASTAFTGAGTQASPYVIPLQAVSTCNGILEEESKTNNLLWCRDATNAVWVNTTMTTAKDQTGIDGVANACSSLTASSDNATCIQTVTSASANRSCSVYLKRITGTGTIQVTMDGITYVTVDLSNGIWNRIVMSATLANPAVGIKIVTSGDAVAMDYGQIESSSNSGDIYATTPILTTTASATRAGDILSIAGVGSNWYNPSKGSFVINCRGGHSNQGFGRSGIIGFNGVSLLQVLSMNGNPNFLISYFNSTPGMYSQLSNLPNDMLLVGGTVATKYDQYGSQVFGQGLIGSLPNTSAGVSFFASALIIDIGRCGSTWINGYIKTLRYFPKALSDKALQNLTL